jgi:hypothetical protein
MLESLRSRSPAVRSAREFEGAMHAACAALDPGLLARTYRVRGDGFTVRRRWFEARGARALARQLVRAASVAVRLAGPRGVAGLEAAVLPYQRYGNGPYPMIWSGMVRQGRLHEEALRFLVWTGQAALAAEIRRNRPAAA